MGGGPLYFIQVMNIYRQTPICVRRFKIGAHMIFCFLGDPLLSERLGAWAPTPKGAGGLEPALRETLPGTPGKLFQGFGWASPRWNSCIRLTYFDDLGEREIQLGQIHKLLEAGNITRDLKQQFTRPNYYMQKGIFHCHKQGLHNKH